MSTAERLEQLRDLPRVTAADRERYKQWEQEARVFLQFNEPRETYFRRDVDTSLRLCGSVPMTDHSTLDLDEWRSYWRSLPDYEGPPMRAPSGVRVSVGTGPSDLILSSALYPPKKEGGLPRMVYTKIAITSPWTEVDPPLDAYAHPSTGGRGWCPKLAGVGE